MMAEAMHRPPGIYLTAEKPPGNPQLSVEVCAASHRLKWSSLIPNYVGRIAQQMREREREREKEGRKEEESGKGIDFGIEMIGKSLLV